MFTPGKARAGFTLVELLVVIVVLVVLAAVILPRFLGAGERGKESALKADLKGLRNAVSRFQNDTSLFPMALADLAAATAPAQGLNALGQARAVTATAWHGPYVDSVPADPISGADFDYYASPDAGHQTGEVRSSASGNGRDGTAYSTW